MHARVLAAVVLGLVAAIVVAAQGNHCSQYADCKDCVSQYLCGWCSMPVVYPGNVTGTQCAGFNPHGNDPFACNGIYSTRECVRGYVCNMSTLKCELGAPGTGKRIDQCEAECQDTGKVYLCNHTSKQCYAVPPGTHGAAALSVCQAACAHPTPHPAPPPHTKPTKLYSCNYTSGQCVEAEAGKGTSKEVCEQECAKSTSTYACNTFLHKCYKLPNGAHGQDLKACETDCNPPPRPGPPPATLGMWRGIAIQNNYKVGEWDINITQTEVEIYDVSGDQKTFGVPFTMRTFQDTYLYIKITSGDGVGKYIRGIYHDSDEGPEGKFFLMALSQPGGPAPSDFNHAMTDGSTRVFFLVQCYTPECKFTMPGGPGAFLQKAFSPMTIQSETSRKLLQSQDPCQAYGQSCSACLAHPHCGWCSTNVSYADGSTGSQCAGFGSSIHNSQPFVCQGRYSTLSCGGYECDFKSLQCKPSNNGNGMPQDLCNEVCQATPTPKPSKQYVCNQVTKQCHPCTKTHCPGSMPEATCESACQHPKHGPSHALIGVWRGIEINLGYGIGEFDLVFDNHTVTMYKSGGQLWKANVTSYGGDLMQLLVMEGVDQGQTFNVQYQYDPAQDFFMPQTLAFGKPDGPVPASYREAMLTPGEFEYAMIKCTSAPCAFHQP